MYTQTIVIVEWLAPFSLSEVIVVSAIEAVVSAGISLLLAVSGDSVSADALSVLVYTSHVEQVSWYSMVMSAGDLLGNVRRKFFTCIQYKEEVFTCIKLATLEIYVLTR